LKIEGVEGPLNLEKHRKKKVLAKEDSRIKLHSLFNFLANDFYWWKNLSTLGK